MNTVFARALVALTLATLPASALASTKAEAKADKAKHGHLQSSVAKKEQPTKKAKHHGHKAKNSKGLAAAAPSGAKVP
jgi:hypothetical protein